MLSFGFDFLLTLVLGAVLLIPVVRLLWKEPLYFVPLFALSYGSFFGLYDVYENLYVQVMSGVRIYLFDFFLILMIWKVFFSKGRLILRNLLFWRYILAFLLILLAGLILKLLVFSSSFEFKLGTWLRTYAPFAIYLLLAKYLNASNVKRLLIPMYGILGISLVVHYLYATGLTTPRTGYGLQYLPWVGEGGAIRKISIPNAFFIMLPIFYSASQLFSRGALRSRGIHILAVASAIGGGFLSLFRMWTTSVVGGVILSPLLNRRRLIPVLASVSGLLLVLFIVFNTVLSTKQFDIYEMMMGGRFGETTEELSSGEFSGSGRAPKMAYVVSQLSNPVYFFLGSVFLSSFKVHQLVVTGDLGLLSIMLYLGIFCTVAIVLLYVRVIRKTFAFARDDLLGPYARTTFLFFVATLPAQLFGWNFWTYDGGIAVVSIFMGFFEGMYRSSHVQLT
jgi:hypothetical protein